MEWLTLFAIAFGPFFGIWAYGIVEERKRVYQRRLDIFKTLMATRGAALSPAHVEALNRIDIEFTDAKYQGIRDKWSAYLDHLGNGPALPPALGSNPSEDEKKLNEKAWAAYDASMALWLNSTESRLVALLSEMSQAFKYKFDEVRIKKGVYRPQAHSDIENVQKRLLNAAAGAFEGRRALPMRVVNWPEQSDEQQAALKALHTTVEDGAYRVRIVTEPPAQAAPNQPKT